MKGMTYIIIAGILVLISMVLVQIGRTKISNEKKNIYPAEFTIELYAFLDGENAMNFVKSLNRDDFKLWITFIQGDLKMYTYLDSKGKWVYNNDINDDTYNGHNYSAYVSDQNIVVKNGTLILENKNKDLDFKKNEKLTFELHYNGNVDLFNVLKFTIRTKDGVVITPKEKESVSIPFTNNIISNVNLKPTNNTIALKGYFEF